MDANLLKDAALSPSIQYSNPSSQRSAAPRVALLTGATGFLGANLLRDLLTSTSLQVLCLLRGSGQIEAMARLKSSLEAQCLWREEFEGRIRPVVGDLSTTSFGLSDSRFVSLGTEVEVIFHNAAQINFLFPYRVLKPANVTGTHEILRLAAIAPKKSFHHVSSTKVLGSLTCPESCKEEFRVPGSAPSTSGYADSKWVAERLVNAAAERGLAVSVYRPGRITGHSDSGICNGHDIFSLMVKACIRLGIAPEFDGHIHLTPVNFVSRAIVELSQTPQSTGKAFHLMNPAAVTWRQVGETLSDARYVRRRVPYDQWRSILNGEARDHRENGLKLLNSLLAGSEPPFSASRRSIALENTRLGLIRVPDLHYPTDIASLLSRYIRYLSSVASD
jgi:thioester reductase-like protein